VSDLHAEAMELVEAEIARVKEAWAVILGADPEVVKAVHADAEREIADMACKQARLLVLRKAIELAAQDKREDATPLSETGA
jgi:hypothetical protein